MKKTLIILAAGLGSRFGGAKQIEGITPRGNVIAEFSVYDAARAGFTDAVFVIKKENEQVFKTRIIDPIAPKFPVSYVFQDDTDLPGGASPAARKRPWGTGHAVYSARHAVKDAFAVINADDFYGADTFVKLSRFLDTAAENRHCMVGFALENTVTPNGTVSRGVCEVKDGRLVDITETHNIIAQSAAQNKNAVVSMNAWGFHKTALDGITRSLTEFLKQNTASPSAEFYLPAAVMALIKDGAQVAVLESREKWYGITYKNDLPHIKSAIAQMVKDEVYPERLWA